MTNLRLKKIFLIILSFAFFFFYFSNTVIYASDSAEPSVSAGSAILIDNRTNKVLYSKNENQKMYPASTTKIMTAILVLENSNLDDVVNASPTAVTSIPSGYSVANIQVGEELTVEQLLECLLVLSANDAANVLAEYVGGSIESFVSMMNTKANELGLEGSHFTNTYGLHDVNHYTTASDLAKLMQYCIKNDDFRRIAGMASCAIPATNKSDSRLYTTTNELLIPNGNYYTSYVTVGKTGFTTPSKGCLASVGYSNNLELTCVVLGSSTTSSRFTDTISLYEYGYSNYSLKDIAKENDVITNVEVSNATKDTKNLDLLISENVSALIKNSDNNENIEPKINLNSEITAPIIEGSVVGTVSYTVNGVEYTSDLIASHDVEKFRIPFYLLLIFIVIVVLLIVYRIFYYTPKKYRKTYNKPKKIRQTKYR